MLLDAFSLFVLWGLAIFVMLLVLGRWVFKNNPRQSGELSIADPESYNVFVANRNCLLCGTGTERCVLYCQKCGMALPDLTDAEDIKIQQRYWSDCKLLDVHGSCREQMHFISVTFHAKYCGFCGVRLEPKLVNKLD